MKNFSLSKLFLTQKDKTDIIGKVDNVKIELIERIESVKTELSATFYKTIFAVGIIQLLAIIGSVLAITNQLRA